MFQIKAYYFGQNWHKDPEPHYITFSGEKLSEVISEYRRAKENLDLAKYEPMRIIDVIDTEEK